MKKALATASLEPHFGSLLLLYLVTYEVATDQIVRTMRSESYIVSNELVNISTYLPKTSYQSTEQIAPENVSSRTKPNTSHHVIHRPSTIPHHHPHLRPLRSLTATRALLPSAPPLPSRLTPHRARNLHRRARWTRHGQRHCIALASSKRCGSVRSVLLGTGLPSSPCERDDEHRCGGLC